MEKQDFSWRVTHAGYMVYYKGQPIGGAGTNTGSYMKSKRHWKHKAMDVKMYQEMAEREINNLLNGHGTGTAHLLDAIANYL
jgi:hypothetical protein